MAVESPDAYRPARSISRITAQKELETLRQFFAFCRERNWTDDNPAKRIKSAKNIKPAEVVPYTPDELTRIIAACDGICRAPYERLRARAMVLLLSNTALRISDVATLERDRVHDGRILLRTKTGGTVYLPVWSDRQTALDLLPIPRGAVLLLERSDVAAGNSGHCRTDPGGGLQEIQSAERARTRFRHTLATRLLGMGGTEQEVADILGNRPEIVRKHYAKWSQTGKNGLTT